MKRFLKFILIATYIISSADAVAINQYHQYHICHFSDSTYGNRQKKSGPQHRLIIENTNIPTTIDIDTSKEVGEINIQSGNSQAGAKTYSVPLKVNPGMRGFEPNLAISYDSHRGSSALGKGWYISGLSVISRIPKSIYYDGQNKGVSLTTEDSYILDDLRLILTGSSSDVLSYQSEYGNIKVKCHISDGVVRYFEVYYPDGNKGIFGFQGSEENMPTYPITSLTDLHGNKIEYSYESFSNSYRISKISYNGASVEFFYQPTRINPTTAYCGGIKITDIHLLSEIILRLGTAETGRYILSHIVQKDIFNKEISSLLSRIDHECNGKELNPLLFYYGTGSDESDLAYDETIMTDSYGIEDTDFIKVIKGRFDYSSADDGIIILPNDNRYLKTQSGNQYFYTNLCRDDLPIFINTKLGNELSYPIPGLLTDKGFIDMMCADLDGKQEEKIIKINNYVDDRRDILTFNVYGQGIFNSLKNEYTRTYDMGYAYDDKNKHLSVHPRHYFTGDFDGDGRTEIMMMPVNGAFPSIAFPSRCHIFDLENDRIIFNDIIFQYNIDFIGNKNDDPAKVTNNSDKLLILDYDGDGKSDMCHVNDLGMSIYTFDVSEEVITARKVYTDFTFDKNYLKDKILLCGEFNGDGMMDLLVSPSAKTESRVWDIYYSMGNGRFEKESFNCSKRYKDDAFVIQDIDGDGKTDLIQYDTDCFDIYLTRGDVPCYVSTINFDGESKNSILVPTNINSHNRSSQLISLNGAYARRYRLPYNTNSESLLTGMVNSLGVVEKNNYMLLNDPVEGFQFYVKGYDAIYPYVNLNEAIPAIVSTSTYTDGRLLGEWSHCYYNAVMHKQGKGFCGFGKIRSYGYSTSLIREYSPYNFGLLVKESIPGHETSLEYDISTSATRLSQINLAKKIDSDILRGFSSSTSFKYDSYGYPTKKETVYSDGSSLKETYAYSNSSDAADGYNLGFVTDHTSSFSRGDDTYIERTYIPARTRRLPNVKVYYKNGRQVETRSYTYDTHGNVLKETVKPYSSQHLQTTSFTYDTFGRPTNVINPVGIENKYVYNDHGLLCSASNHYGKTSFNYDEFGRQTIVSYPDSTTRSIDYKWATDMDGALYYISETHTGEPDSIRYYDSLNREIRTAERRRDNSFKKIDRTYDQSGNIIKISEPYKGEHATLWNIYSYDTYNRLVKSISASGETTAITYNKATVTTTDSKKSFSRTYDVLGYLISVTDPSGSARYAYGADGQLSSVTLDDGITITADYDEYRRRAGLHDPSLGYTRYSYDDAGNIASESYANGDMVSYEYDSHNRIIGRDCGGLHTDFTYNDKDELISVSSDNGTSTFYTYDSFGRIIESNERGQDIIFLKRRYTYSRGNVSSIKYTTRYGVLASETHNYKNGFLDEVILNDKTSIFKINGENEFGQPTEIQTGKLTRKYEFTGNGLPSRRFVSTSSSVIQDFSYNFDLTTGNLLSRSDNTRNLSEIFGYDNLDRLVSFDGNSVQYDAAGNIVARSDIGNLQYSIPEKPFAVSGVTLYDYAISSLQQDIVFTGRRPSSISEGNTTASFIYNASNDRVRMKVVTGDKTVLDRHYLGGCYEIDRHNINVTEKLYLLGDYYSAPAVIVNNTMEAVADTLRPLQPEPAYPINSSTSETNSLPILDNYDTLPSLDLKYGKITYYILRDYLGNITHVVTSTGVIKQELSYDAWGRLRNPSSWESYPYDDKSTPFLGRGYTGHEHLPWFGLVNMNARLYDPYIGRFLSPDPFVQSPDWIQNFNRYAYAMNNPLCYIDEDGELFWTIIGVAALTGGIVNVVNHWDTITAAGGWKGFWRGAGYFTIGAADGGIGAALGVGATVGFGSMLGVTSSSLAAATTGFLPGFISGATTGLAEGMILRTSNSMMEGENLGNSLADALKGSAMDAILGGISGGVNSGAKAFNQGKNVWDGSANKVYTGYFGYDDLKNVRYVGITGRNPDIRFAEHLNSKSPRADLNYRIQKTFNTKIEARIWEQTKINMYRMEKYGGMLYNKINLIAPKYWERYGIKP